ncbi:hypothetical protein ACXR0O_19450 [Verrucomicrobiota bacterium sgz303538]
MSKMRPHPAKILSHSEGLGTPDAEMVRRRAMEIALINGRKEFTNEDYRLAKIELHGHGPNGHLSNEWAAEMMYSEADMLVVDVGRHTENLGMEDDGNVIEELIEEGLNEALHEQMLAARREMKEEDEEEEEADML